jgi:hypothetical protein
MFEEKDRTIFDSKDVSETVETAAESASAIAEMARPSHVEQQPSKSFADWIAQGYLPG